MSKRRAMFIGRWQPLHKGHLWLVDQKLAEGKPVLIAVRDIAPDEKNPFTTEDTVKMIEMAYEGKDVEVIVIPDIESVNYGRGVGYEINEFVPPSDIEVISATEIRRKIKEGDHSWKDKVHPAIHQFVADALSEAIAA